ncbi:hypothetical protein ACP4OV_015630 [Aristida adscensionis]
MEQAARPPATHPPNPSHVTSRPPPPPPPPPPAARHPYSPRRAAQ